MYDNSSNNICSLSSAAVGVAWEAQAVQFGLVHCPQGALTMAGAESLTSVISLTII